MRNLIFTFLAAINLINPVFSWDEVTHAYMTKMIPDLIQNQQLKSLIQRNQEEFIYGCWYTDTYQYTDNRVNSLNPHNISEYSRAFTSYLQKENIKKQENYEKLVALYLGSLAHILEDFWYDSNLHKYQFTKSDKYKGDSKHGAFIIKQNGYLKLKVKRYFPVDDLFNMYKEARMLKEDFNTTEDFEKLIDAWSNTQYLLLRSLKLINFLGGNQMYNESLWTAGNLKTIKGGMINSAEVAAKFIEATWMNLEQYDSPLFLHADYFDFNNKITILASSPLKPGDYSKLVLLNSSNDTIMGKTEPLADARKKKDVSGYTISFFPIEKLQTNKSYRLIINGSFNQNPFTYNLTNSESSDKVANRKSFFSTIGLGIFGFIPMLAIAGLFIGLSGIIRVKWSLQNGILKMPFILKFTDAVLVGIAIFALATGIYLLLTRGALIIELAL